MCKMLSCIECVKAKRVLVEIFVHEKLMCFTKTVSHTFVIESISSSH